MHYIKRVTNVVKQVGFSKRFMNDMKKADIAAVPVISNPLMSDEKFVKPKIEAPKNTEKKFNTNIQPREKILTIPVKVPKELGSPSAGVNEQNKSGICFCDVMLFGTTAYVIYAAIYHTIFC